MKFQYTGVTRQRETVRGVVEGADETEARMRLRALQIRPSAFRAVRAESVLNMDLRRISLGASVPLRAMMIFTRQFSSLIDSGVPVVQCLDILQQQERRPLFKRVLGQVKGDIEGGSGLAESLSRHPGVFSDFFVRIVEAGEMSGTLDVALRRVGIQLEKLGRLKSKVIGALLYPCITLIVAAGVLVFMLVKVVPEVAKLYGEASAQLPELTVAVLAISDWLQSNYLFILAGIGAVIGLMVFLYRIPAFREVWDPILLRIPLFGTLVKKASIARFARTMGTLVASGVPLILSFEICARLVSNRAIRDSIQKAASSVNEGKTIAAGLALNGFFPPMVVHMVNIGEMTGKLDELLTKVAEMFDEEVDDAVGTLTGLLQPLLIIAVGGVIAFLLLAMYLPIFQLAEKVTGGM